VAPRQSGPLLYQGNPCVAGSSERRSSNDWGRCRGGRPTSGVTRTIAASMPRGFEVCEQTGGESNMASSCRVVGRRKDIKRDRHFAKADAPLPLRPAPKRAPRRGAPGASALRGFIPRLAKRRASARRRRRGESAEERRGSHPSLTLLAFRYLRLTYAGRYIARQKMKNLTRHACQSTTGRGDVGHERRSAPPPQAARGIAARYQPSPFFSHTSSAPLEIDGLSSIGLCWLRTAARFTPGVLQLIQQAYLGSSERALIVLEGWDTAGKGGVVRRLGWALDPRSFKVYPISAPDVHERAEHYLQRSWRHLPEEGQIVVFDRSWYGRVLVERVEGLATEAEWKRAYREINSFERMLTDCGIRVVKLFLHITSKEQARRFRDRLVLYVVAMAAVIVGVDLCSSEIDSGSD
jgi:Polyphosphate kinase 2 (PPK2)